MTPRPVLSKPGQARPSTVFVVCSLSKRIVVAACVACCCDLDEASLSVGLAWRIGRRGSCNGGADNGGGQCQNQRTGGGTGMFFTDLVMPGLVTWAVNGKLASVFVKVIG